MRTVTSCGRWLGLFLVLACFVGNAYAQHNVTLRLNTATAPDTLDAMDVVQVRGAVNGTGGATLPDGNVVDWNDTTTLRPENVGGDNWEITFQLGEGDTLAFKFYAQLLEDDLVGGWEDGDNHVISGLTGDSTLTLHYFEKGEDKPYDWRPFEGAPGDSIGVWFRVFMNTNDALTAGYDAENPAVIGLRGDDFAGGGPLDWGATLPLTRESDDSSKPGYHIFSGVAYYPDSLAGRDQAFKFINGAEGWESRDNRSFTIPASDSTLPWLYFNDSTPLSTMPVESNILFAVDLAPFEAIGVFRRARGDTLYVFGDFNGWAGCRDTNPDLCLMEREPGEDIFSAALPLTLVPDAGLGFKYFLDFNDEGFRTEFGVDPPSGWEEGHATGTNRRFTFAGTPEQDLGLQFFNDVTSANIIPAGTSVDVLFAVEMSTAVANDAQPFVAGSDSVTVRLGDPIWAFTQGINESRDGSDMPLLIDSFVLTDDDADGVYTGTLTVNGPTYSNLTFRYAYGQGGTFFEDQGSDTNTPGRNRTYYIKPNGDGTWPASYALTALPDTFQVESGPLPFEGNPALATGIEVINDEVPENVWLGANYPNPFNPTTTFEYSIDRTQFVTIRVYDMLGRIVATLVDGTQPAAVYQVSFDASNLASGVYFYRLETQSKVLSKRMLLIK